jgi:hypothetical protein
MAGRFSMKDRTEKARLHADIAGIVAAMTEDELDVPSEKLPTTFLG